jgi:hypothetical protein
VAYATAHEVDAIRRTLDKLMKKQYAFNSTMENSLGKLVASVDKLTTKVGVQAPEDMGSNVKGKHTAIGQQGTKPPFVPQHTIHVNKSNSFWRACTTPWSS